MREPLYLSRATLRRDVPASALRALLQPSTEAARIGAGHRLVWTLFADSAQRERDFLWRDAGGGKYYFLSRRPPEDRHGLFEVDEPKTFTPALNKGDILQFSLRANATISRKTDPAQRRGKPCDVVMNALHRIPPGQRAEARRDAITEAGTEWLRSQAVRAGFELPVAPQVSAYQVVRVEHGGPDARLGILDFDGRLVVRDPGTFVTAVGRGFGRAKAFGCGLMLLKRIERAE